MVGFDRAFRAKLGMNTISIIAASSYWYQLSGAYLDADYGTLFDPCKLCSAACVY